MFNKKVLTLVLAGLSVVFLNSPLMAQGQGGSGSSDKGQGKSGDTVTIDDAGGQAQAAGDQTMDQTQQKQQSKAQEQKKTQKKEQKKLQKKTQKKEQKKNCTQDKSQQKSGEQKGKTTDEAKGQGQGKAGAPEEGAATDAKGQGQGKAGAPEEGAAAEKITGKGKIVKTEDGYAIECGDKQYKPLNLQEKYQQEGLEIDFTAEKPAGENTNENAISILEISSSENLEEVPVVSEEQAKEGQIMQEQKGSMKQQGKSKLTNDF